MLDTVPTPDFPAWAADLLDADEFGVDPRRVTLVLRTKLDKENVPEDLLSRVLEALGGVFDGPSEAGASATDSGRES